MIQKGLSYGYYESAKSAAFAFVYIIKNIFCQKLFVSTSSTYGFLSLIRCI